MRRLAGLVLLVLSFEPAFGAVIRVPLKIRFTTADYVLYVFRRLPLEQLRVEPDSSKVHLQGDFEIDLHAFNRDRALVIQNAIENFSSGRVEVGGFTLDSSASRIVFSVPQRDIKELWAQWLLVMGPLPFDGMKEKPPEVLPEMKSLGCAFALSEQEFLKRSLVMKTSNLRLLDREVSSSRKQPKDPADEVPPRPRRK